MVILNVSSKVNLKGNSKGTFEGHFKGKFACRSCFLILLAGHVVDFCLQACFRILLAGHVVEFCLQVMFEAILEVIWKGNLGTYDVRVSGKLVDNCICWGICDFCD